jgi:hypothetical protein
VSLYAALTPAGSALVDTPSELDPLAGLVTGVTTTVTRSPSATAGPPLPRVSTTVVPVNAPNGGPEYAVVSS